MKLAEVKENQLVRGVWNEIRDYAALVNAQFKQVNAKEVFGFANSFGGDEGDVVLLRKSNIKRDVFKIESSKVADFIDGLDLVPVKITWGDNLLDQYVINVKALQ